MNAHLNATNETNATNGHDKKLNRTKISKCLSLASTYHTKMKISQRKKCTIQ